MKYKVGDKIVMKKSKWSTIHNEFYEKYNYIFTIDKADGEYYRMKEDKNFWYKDRDIESFPTPIYSRFEILDL